MKKKKKFAYTDYPFEELGDAAGFLAPIRKVKLRSYDGDKYVTVKVEGKILTVKYGYLYKTECREGEGETISLKRLKKL